jgi:signal transduction histidine kinase/DNA-binding response OmpR family regulator/CHASE3 domain sensor protein
MKKNATSRLFLGFATAFIISLAVGVVTYVAFQKQAEESRNVRHSYQVMTQLNSVQNYLVDMETGRRAFRMTNEKSFLDPYFAGNRRINSVIIELKKLVEEDATQTDNVQLTEAAIEKILRYWQGLPLDASQYTRDDLLRITTREKGLMDSVRADLALCLEYEGDLLLQRQQETGQALSMSNKIAVSGSALTQIIILILIYLIVNEFNTRRKAEIALQENLNELNELNEESNNRNWQLLGVSNINDSLQGIEDVPTLTANVLQTLKNYLDVPAGAIYNYNEENKKLELAASVALPESAQKSYALGEGLVGNAAKADEVTIVKNIPASYWAIKSGVGETVPGELMYLPLWYNNELKGIIEIASFNSFTPLQIDLANVTMNNIATALNAADAREKIMLLLEQVQEQKLSLQNQQEELRQTNEELTRQAEVLQASEEELRVQEEELRQINAELEEKNEAVELSRQALSMKARELEVTSKYKSEFLANMSHELRTPLNSVLILAKLLSENKADNLTVKQVEYANVIHKSGSDLLNIINDILDLSKIEAGKIDFNFEDVPVKGIMHDVLQTFQVIAEEKSVKLFKTIDDTVSTLIHTDKMRLEQVLKNMLSNAFKFTPKHGSVTLAFNTTNHTVSLQEEHLRTASSVLVISVKDTGIGIPPEKQQMIFEAFQQADGSTSRRYGGTGLGLSISKELVKKLGGEMRLESEEGKGSTFFVYLPLEQVKEQPYATHTDNVEVKDVDLSNITEQTRLEDDRSDLKKGDKVMLIIEDDPQFASVVQDFARNKKYKTIVALQGDEGLYYARKFRPSAIILDIQLPVLDGWTILKLLKADKNLKDIPVHIMSATDDMHKGQNAAVAFLKKPLEKEDLENAFSTINKYIDADIKKLLILSGSHVKDDLLKQLIGERKFDIECKFVATADEAATELQADSYDTVIVDIGSDLERGKSQLAVIQKVIKDRSTPVILYLDKDISAQDELQFKKLSDVVIRNSSQADDRLMDEIELFLYKVQEVERTNLPKTTTRSLVDENMLQGKKVLLADDDMRNVFALTNMLEERGIEVITAEDGKDAIQKLHDNPDVDIVLMDIMMPEMNGYEATRVIRADSRFSNLPIIALTAKAMQGDREKTIEAGASDYITKPVDASRLFSLMRVWLSV